MCVGCPQSQDEDKTQHTFYCMCRTRVHLGKPCGLHIGHEVKWYSCIMIVLEMVRVTEIKESEGFQYLMDESCMYSSRKLTEFPLGGLYILGNLRFYFPLYTNALKTFLFLGWNSCI